jgi:prepilin-type N-terminal cleavage/methylation domain-containing protein
MASPPRQAGFTLVETVVAMSVLVIGAVGLISLHTVGARMNSDARVMTRATALAQDLVTQMQSWDFVNDPRLANTVTTNDADFADGAGAFEGAVTSGMYDHEESELESQGAPYTWLGTPTATAQLLGFKRYWNVAEVDYDDNGALNARRIAVIVRWGVDGGGRRIVLVTALRNPSNTN